MYLHEEQDRFLESQSRKFRSKIIMLVRSVSDRKICRADLQNVPCNVFLVFHLEGDLFPLRGNGTSRLHLVVLVPTMWTICGHDDDILSEENRGIHIRNRGSGIARTTHFEVRDVHFFHPCIYLLPA